MWLELCQSVAERMEANTVRRHNAVRCAGDSSWNDGRGRSRYSIYIFFLSFSKEKYAVLDKYVGIAYLDDIL